MHVSVAVTVDASPATAWALVSGIERAARTISGIEKIEVLERRGDELLGLKWRETRTMFGKEAVETMWITDVDEGSRYRTEARSHGAIYRTDVRVAAAQDGTTLSMDFSGESQTLLAKVMAFVLRPLMKRTVKDALLKDLEDVKRAAESRPSAHGAA